MNLTLGEHLNRLFWLLDIIATHGPISLREINERWIRRSNFMEPINRQVFMREKETIQEVFGIDIVKVGQNKYKISDPQHNMSRSVHDHMLASIHESNFMSSFRELGSLISIPTVYKGSEYLSMIGEALTEGIVLNVMYHKYDADAYTTELEPYCLKLFNRRWYLYAKKQGEDQIKCFSLDRVVDMELSDKKFARDEDFNPESFFGNYYGVYLKGDVEDVMIRTTKVSMKFLTDLPLHHSQRLVNEHDALIALQRKGVEYKPKEEYQYYFKFHIAPTPDFENELLRLCENCEILYPIWFREKVHERLVKAVQIMKKD